MNRLKSLNTMVIISLFWTNSLSAKNNQYCLNEAEQKQISKLIQDHDYCKEQLENFMDKENKPKLEKDYIIISVVVGFALGFFIRDEHNGRIEKKNK